MRSKNDLFTLAKLGAEHIVKKCANANANDRILIIKDKKTSHAADLIYECARRFSDQVHVCEMSVMANHGQEPPKQVVQEMHKASLIIAVTKFSLAHSSARLSAQRLGARYLSLADYSLDVLSSPSIFGVDDKEINTMSRLAGLMTAGSTMNVTSAKGTDINLDINGRVANNCPGIIKKPGEFGSPPDMEVNISPIENNSDGILVVDGSVTHPRVGVLNDDLFIHIENGGIANIEGSAPITKEIKSIFDAVCSERAFLLAEVGVGFNAKARLCGHMLIDEGASDCLHFGFGSNHTVGGLNEVPFHVDFVMRNGSILIDGETVIENGGVIV